MGVTSRFFLALLLAWWIAAPPVAAQTRPVFIENMTWTEVRDALAAGTTSAIIYTGSTEQNGPHMAIGKHNWIAHHVAGRIARELGNALAYPVLPFAPTGGLEPRSGHMRFPGSVTLRSASYAAVVRDVALSALASGFRNVFLMGDHGGGQDDLKRVAAELDRDWSARGAHVYHVADLYFKSREANRAYLSARGMAPGEHAGVEDTSELMYLDTGGRWIRRGRLAASNAGDEPRTGVLGDPTRASPQLGEVFIRHKVDSAVAQIRRFLSARP